jgi:hypothetical protein
MKHPGVLLFLAALPAAAAPRPVAAADSLPLSPPPTYADLAALSDGTPLVIRAEVRSVAPVEAARAPGLKPGRALLYVEARTQALVAGQAAVGEALRYLVDLPLDAKGKPPKLKKQVVLLFARAVPARPGELQLVAPDAQLTWSPALEARIKALLGELYAAGAPPRVTAVREAIHVGGALAGEGETQLFLSTAAGEPAAITVTRRPGAPAAWRVSFSELVEAAAAPAQGTLAWYRLACSLPRQLPTAAHVSADPGDRVAAEVDYRFVLEQLGPCTRTR